MIANAGVGEAIRQGLDWAVVEQMIQVNVTGAAATLCAALPGMVEEDGTCWSASPPSRR